MGLILFTTTFPYYRSEQFLVDEFKFIEKRFTDIDVMTFSAGGQTQKLNLNPGVTSHTSIVFNHKSKWELFRKGIFNLSPFHYHARDFFEKRLYAHPNKLRLFLTSLLIARATIASPAYSAVVKKIKASSDTTFLYFYWGDNLCWVLPYLKDRVKNKDTKAIIRLHRVDLYEYLNYDYAPLRRFIFEQAYKLVAISNNGAAYLKENYPACKEKIMVSKLGVRDNGAGPYTASDNYTLLSVSIIMPVKRVHLIAQALGHIKKRITWHHIGDGPLLSGLLEEISRLPENITVKLEGYMENPGVLEFYKHHQADLFVNVSESEGLPVSIMEAFSFGVPVVATNVGGTSELVNDDTGKLVPASVTPVELAAEIDRLLSATVTERAARRTSCRKKFEAEVSAEVNYTRFYNTVFV